MPGAGSAVTPLPSADALSSQFAAVRGWEARLQALARLGEALPPLPDGGRTEANRVQGCDTPVWLVHRLEHGRLWFAADADSRIVRGLLAVLLTAVQGAPVDEVRAFDLERWFATLGLSGELSSSRRDGVRAIARRIRVLAAAAD